PRQGDRRGADPRARRAEQRPGRHDRRREERHDHRDRRFRLVPRRLRALVLAADGRRRPRSALTPHVNALATDGRTTLWVSLGAVVLAVGAALSLAVGVVPISLGDMLAPDEREWMLLTQVRIPRMVAVLLSGAALAVAGLIMQRVTQN